MTYKDLQIKNACKWAISVYYKQRKSNYFKKSKK